MMHDKCICLFNLGAIIKNFLKKKEKKTFKKKKKNNKKSIRNEPRRSFQSSVFSRQPLAS
jgi:hypothetical protein